MIKDWGKEESQLRTAIYVSFLKETDFDFFKKRAKKQIRRSRASSLMSSV